jgi:hypothetical protein
MPDFNEQATETRNSVISLRLRAQGECPRRRCLLKGKTLVQPRGQILEPLLL